MQEITGTLENWLVDANYWGSGEVVIWGDIYKDTLKRWREGTRIHTSPIVTELEKLIEGALVRSKNSTYLLGKPFDREE